jgi:outer membrane protein
MKNFSFLLNLVLLLAVAVLYYLHFATSKKSAVASATIAKDSETKLVFVNTDSLLENYEFFKKTKLDMEAKQKGMKAELESKALALQREFESAQGRVSSMTAAEAKATEEQLGRKQQALQEREQNLNEELSTQMDAMNEKLITQIHEYLKEWNKEKGYNFVLGYQRGSGILYAQETLDVTKEVLSGMNEKYLKEKK